MVLSDKNIEDFKIIYKKKFGKDISVEDAREHGEKLVRLMSLLYRPTDQRKFEVEHKLLLKK